MFEFNHAGDAQADQQHCHSQAHHKYHKGSEAEFPHLASKVITQVDALAYINSKVIEPTTALAHSTAASEIQSLPLGDSIISGSYRREGSYKFSRLS
jgi:hypothetical protein